MAEEGAATSAPMPMSSFVMFRALLLFLFGRTSGVNTSIPASFVPWNAWKSW